MNILIRSHQRGIRWCTSVNAVSINLYKEKFAHMCIKSDFYGKKQEDINLHSVF